MKNKPYVNTTGLPLSENYIHGFQNRKQRREYKQKNVFIGNGKQYPLTIVGSHKYLRKVQVVDGKRILHYLAA